MASLRFDTSKEPSESDLKALIREGYKPALEEYARRARTQVPYHKTLKRLIKQAKDLGHDIRPTKAPGSTGESVKLIKKFNNPNPLLSGFPLRFLINPHIPMTINKKILKEPPRARIKDSILKINLRAFKFDSETSKCSEIEIKKLRLSIIYLNHIVFSKMKPRPLVNNLDYLISEDAYKVLKTNSFKSFLDLAGPNKARVEDILSPIRKGIKEFLPLISLESMTIINRITEREFRSLKRSLDQEVIFNRVGDERKRLPIYSIYNPNFGDTWNLLKKLDKNLGLKRYEHTSILSDNALKLTKDKEKVDFIKKVYMNFNH